MNIIYIGNFKPIHSTENHIASSLEALGHKVFRYQENLCELDVILDNQNDYDFVLYTRTWDNVRGDRDKFLHEKLSLPFVGVHLDIWKGLDREKEIKKQLFFECDYLFTADGGHQEDWERDGIKHIWLPPGVFHEECYLGTPREEYKTDVLFVGSYYYHPEYPFRRQLIDFLRETYGDRFKLWGATEDTKIRGKDLNDLYASAKVVVGDSLESPYYWSDRIPETLGRGGFLLHPETEGLSDVFPDLETYDRNDLNALKQKIDYYLANDTERENKRLRNHEMVKKNHTYKNKMEFLINYLKKEKK